MHAAAVAPCELMDADYGSSFVKCSWLLEAVLSMPTKQELLITSARRIPYSSAPVKGHPELCWLSNKVQRTDALYTPPAAAVCLHVLQGLKWARRELPTTADQRDTASNARAGAGRHAAGHLDAV